MNADSVQQISSTVLSKGFHAAKKSLTGAEELAFADLVEDIRVWDTQPEHRTGTVGDQRTSEALVSRLAASQVTAKTIQFPFQRRVPTEAWVEINGQRLNGIPLFDGGETNGTLEGTLANFGEEGTIGVGSAAMGGKSQDHQLPRHLMGSTYRALIGISRNTTPGITMLNADSFKSPHRVPALLLDREYEAQLKACADQGTKAKLRVDFQIERTIATNVELHIAGHDSDLAPLVVMTPKSSWWTSTAERCGGIAAWLAAARELAAHRPRRDVIFTANTGHELGHVGLEYFLDQHANLATNAHAWVHLGANFAAKGCRIRAQYANDRMKLALFTSLEAHNVEVADEIDGSIRPGGEARNIFDAGGTYVSLLGSNDLFHHPDDRMTNNVDLDAAMRTRNVAVDLVKSLSE